MANNIAEYSSFAELINETGGYLYGYCAVKTSEYEGDDWLRLRQLGIGGSDVAAILGLNPYKSPLDVYNDKILTEFEPLDSEPAYWGTTLEEIVCQEYAKRKGAKIQNVNYTIVHPEHSWCLANIDKAIINEDIAKRVYFKDGVLTTDILFEGKTASEYKSDEWGESESEEIPDYYIPQCQWYMLVTGAKCVKVGVLIGGNKFKTFSVERNEELIEIIFQTCEDFWFNHVVAGVPPEPTTSEDFALVVPQDKIKNINDDEMSIVDKYKEVKKLEKKVKASVDAAKLELQKVFGDFKFLYYDGKKVASNSSQTKTGISSKLLKEKHPSVYAEVEYESRFNVVRTSK